MNWKIVITLILTALCVYGETACAVDEDTGNADKVILVLNNNEEKALDGCRVDGPYFCDKNGRFCIHENNIKALKGDSWHCGGTGIIGNLQQAKGLIQEAKGSSEISDWFNKACEDGIKRLYVVSKADEIIADKNKLESIKFVEGETPTKSDIGQGKTFRFIYDAKYSNNRQLRLGCLINTRMWIYYIHQ
ncbi:MAG: hypothetical protein HQK96_00315 [Nitrospirae bacterium]|nr:hypothetical protein [Nitrospirota bacterium]